MSKHTPGPWHSFSPQGSAAVNPNGAAFLIGPTRLYMDKSCGFLVADAQLISAAPDLLDALNALLPALMSKSAMMDKNDWMAVEKANAAIAKARGES